jgi:hypothetical protein
LFASVLKLNLAKIIEFWLMSLHHDWLDVDN